MTGEELAYAAGLFDGEGNISICSNGRDGHFYLRAAMSSTDAELVEFFHHRWAGGWISRQERGGNRRDQWRWDIKGAAAAAFLRAVLPHMRKQRGAAKAELAIEFQDQRSRRMVGEAPGRGEYMARQREYHRRMLVLTGRAARAGL